MSILTKDDKSIRPDTVVDFRGAAGLEIIERELQDSLNNSCGTIREMGLYILNSGGKRIRPLLAIHSGLIFADISPDLIGAAVAAELIHMATLAHDDIIDNSDLRRSQPSLNRAWGNSFGVLCGDFLFARAFGILSRRKLYQSLDLMVEAIDNMCNGEILQANNRFNPRPSIEGYYEQITKKTAIFMACCCQSGAGIGGASEAQVRAVGEYGLNLGLAFQITDDILDYSGDPVAMGKPRGEDFRQGIMTLPLILLLQNAQYQPMAAALMSKSERSEPEFGLIVDLLHSSEAIEEAKKTAASHLEAAKNSLRLLPVTPASNFLYQLADKFKSRSN